MIFFCATILNLFFLFLAATLILNYAVFEKVIAGSNWIILKEYTSYLRWITPAIMIALSGYLAFQVWKKSEDNLSDFAAAMLILLFLYTGISKLLEHKAFIDQLEISPWKPISVSARFIAITLPISELVVAAMLFTTRFRNLGFRLSGLMLGIFTIYLTVLIFSGHDLPCTCGGVIAYMSWPNHLILNITFLIISFMGILLTVNDRKLLALR